MSLTESKGFSIIEALIALSILTFGILAIAGLQMHALNTTEQAYWQSQVTVRLNSISERLRANHSEWGRKMACSRWNQINQTLSPKLHGECNCQFNSCSIKLEWNYKKSFTKSVQVIL